MSDSKSHSKNHEGKSFQKNVSTWFRHQHDKDVDAPPPMEEDPVPDVGQEEKGTKEESTGKKILKLTFKISFGILAVSTALKGLATIGVAILTAIVNQAYTKDQSGRLVAHVLLAVTAAVAVAASIYAMIAVFDKKKRPVHIAAIVLVIMAVLQGIIVGTGVKFTEDDEFKLGGALVESFRMATKEHNPRHVKMWALTQSQLNCCGVYSAEDYRVALPPYFAPDVPISCCPGYDSGRSELLQERERESCRAKKEYYALGCRGQVVESFKNNATFLMTVTITLIVFEVLLALACALMSSKLLKKNRAQKMVTK